MLSILSKDEAKQKEIEARAAQTVLEGQRASEAKKLLSPKVPTGTPVKSPSSAKKATMSIQQIPSFDALKKKKPPTLAVPPTAHQDIALSTSPPGSNASVTTQSQAQPKLNPKATTFSFKPNPAASAFKPGQPSAAAPQAPTSAAAAAGPIVTPTQAPVASNAAQPSVSTSPALRRQTTADAGVQQQQPHMPTAGPSYKNQFFTSRPHQVSVNLRDDFYPWRHGPVTAPDRICEYTPSLYDDGQSIRRGVWHGSIADNLSSATMAIHRT